MPPPAVIGRLSQLKEAADVGDGLALAVNCSTVLSIRMIGSAVCLVRFGVASTAQCGRLRTILYSGQLSRVDVRTISDIADASLRDDA